MLIAVMPDYIDGFNSKNIKKYFGIDCKVGDIVDIKLPMFDETKLKIKK